MFVDVFKKQDAAADLGEVGGAQHGLDHCEVAAPQAAAQLQPVEAGFGAKAYGLEFARHGLHKGLLGDVIAAKVAVGAAEVLARHRAGPEPGTHAFTRLSGPGRAMGHGPQLQCGHVAVTHPGRSLLDAALQRLPVDPVEDATQSVASSRGERHGGPFCSDAMQGGQAAVVIPRKPLLFEQRRLIDADIESQGLEAAGRLANRGGLGDDAGGAEQGEIIAGSAHLPIVAHGVSTA